MTWYLLVVWINIFFAGYPFLFGVHATWLNVFNACVAMLMLWAAPVKQGNQ